ncbi:MAG: hypothetical protein CL849_06625 [Crocinitomicaceae bacterium]|nr:hypothetical protein [Crocinitomicaceae bacterium]
MNAAPQPSFLLNALPLLLHDHDCLVIPGLGGFVARPVAAHFDQDKGEWIPPGRDVLFNPKLTVRDGLLEQEIRRATGCSNEAAAQWLENETEALHSSLKEGRHVALQGLGRLYLTDSGALGFVAEPRLSERYAAPGLSRIAWADNQIKQPVQEEAATQASTQPLETEGNGVAQIQAQFPKQLLKVAAALALPIMITGALLWNQQNTTGFDFLGLSSEPLETAFAPRIDGEDIRFPDLDLGDALPFIQAGAPALIVPRIEEELMPVPIPRSTASGCGHHVIAGAFAESRRAAALARRFEALGYSSAILPGPNGVQRVSAGCFEHGRDAALFRRAIAQRHGFAQAWVLNL